MVKERVIRAAKHPGAEFALGFMIICGCGATQPMQFTELWLVAAAAVMVHSIARWEGALAED